MSVAETNPSKQTPGPRCCGRWLAPRGRITPRAIWTGFLLGCLIGLGCDQINLDALFFGFAHPMVAGGIFGAVVGCTRARRLLWPMAGFLIVVALVLSYSPLVGVLMRSMTREDSPQRCPAVVILGCGFHNDQTIGAPAEDRLLKGMQLLKAGWASEIVLTRPNGEASVWPKQAVDQMRSLGIDYSADVVGPVVNTHDEALLVAELARQRHWDRVLLVTHSWHMPRAAATFEKAGVHVVCAPCGESAYDLEMLATPGDRLAAFGDWMHEEIGFWVYRWRGWV